MEIGDPVDAEQVIDMGVPVQADEDFVGVLADDFLDLFRIIHCRRAGEGLMGNDNNRSIMACQFFLEPIHLLLSHKRGIATPVGLRPLVVSIKDEQTQSTDVVAVVTALHSPNIEALLDGVSTVRVVIPDDVQRRRMSLLELCDNRSVLLHVWVSKIPKLHDGIGLGALHLVQKGIQTPFPIVHDVLVEIGDESDGDRLLQTSDGSGSRQ